MAPVVEHICDMHRVYLGHIAAQHRHNACGRHALSSTAWLRQVKKFFGRLPRRLRHSPPRDAPQFACCGECAYKCLRENFAVVGDAMDPSHGVCIAQIAQWVVDPRDQLQIIRKRITEGHLLHVFTLVKWGKWPLPNCQAKRLLQSLKPDDVHAFIPQLLELAPLTEDDTAFILAVGPFDTRRYLTVAPVVTDVRVMKRAAVKVAKQIADICLDDKRCTYISPHVAAELTGYFGEGLSGEQQVTLLALRRRSSL